MCLSVPVHDALRGQAHVYTQSYAFLHTMAHLVFNSVLRRTRFKLYAELVQIVRTDEGDIELCVARPPYHRSRGVM